MVVGAGTLRLASAIGLVVVVGVWGERLEVTMSGEMSVLEAAPIHALVYGDPGMRKSSLAATFPSPILVVNFDSPANIRPYVDRGVTRGGSFEHTADPTTSPPTPVTLVKGASGKVVVEVHHFQDQIANNPTAWRRFDAWFNLYLSRGTLPATIVVDTLSSVELAARKQDQYHDNSTTKNPLQWWGASARALEELLCMRLPALPCHVVAICHMDEDQDVMQGRMVRNPALPTKLRKRVAAYFSEMWRCYCEFNQQNEIVYKVQTQASPDYFAKSAIRAASGSPPDFKALFASSAAPAPTQPQ